MVYNISITGDITDDSLSQYIDELKGYDRQETTVIVNISSYGGLLEPAVILGELLSEFENTIAYTTVCCSASTIIFLACKVRIVSKDCIFLIHRPTIDVYDANYGDCYMAGDVLFFYEEGLIDIYSKFCDVEVFLPYMLANVVIPNDELISMKFATEVL